MGIESGRGTQQKSGGRSVDRAIQLGTVLQRLMGQVTGAKRRRKKKQRDTEAEAQAHSWIAQGWGGQCGGVGFASE